MLILGGIRPCLGKNSVGRPGLWWTHALPSLRGEASVKYALKRGESSILPETLTCFQVEHGYIAPCNDCLLPTLRRRGDARRFAVALGSILRNNIASCVCKVLKPLGSRTMWIHVEFT